MASVQALSGITNLLTSIKDNLRSVNAGALASGLRPVYRITTSESLSSGYVDEIYLANTIPDWVGIKSYARTDPRSFDFGLTRRLLKQKWSRIGDFQNPIEENAVIGILMDESPKNIYRYLVDIIMSNVPYITADGKRRWLAEDFIMLGYPIQLTIGFIDADGNFRKHPNEPPASTYIGVEPDFTGLLGALTQETYAGGDYFQGTFVGFEYLLSRYKIKERFPIKSKEQVKRTLGRLLRWLATRHMKHITSPTRPGDVITTGEATISIPILRAMGVVETGGSRILSTTEIADNIEFLDMPKYTRTSSRTIPSFAGNKEAHVLPGSTFRDVIEFVETLTKTTIYFNGHGRLVVSGKPKVREIATKSYPRIRVHDAILGSHGNVIHHQSTIDLSQIVNRVIIHKKFSGINAGNPQFAIAHPNAGIMTDDDEVTKYYADDLDMGETEVYTYGDFTGDEQGSQNAEAQMVDHFRYYGMRGTCFMIGNPKIRAGDVIRMSDIRSFGNLGVDNQAGADMLSKEIRFTIDNVDSGGMQFDPLIEKSFRLKSGIDHFYVWKVIHYIGPDGFSTKVFYTKESDSYRPASDLLSQHIRRRRRGVEAEFK